jgi:hypothetical protein
MFMAFDLLHQDGVDLRALPLSERKRDLRQLCRKSRVPFMRQGKPHCYSITAASLVSRASCPSALTPFERPSRNWVKMKCPGWTRINSARYRLFEGPRKPELTEARRRSRKSARCSPRVMEHLRSADLSPVLRKQQAILKREIAELEWI